jgi:hypothetical protein
MDRLQSMRVFKQVVTENGFGACARKLGCRQRESRAWSVTWKTTWGCGSFSARRDGSH